MTSDSLFTHPCDALDTFVEKLNEVPGLQVEAGDGLLYSIRRLRSLYDHVRESLPIKVGDRVRVNDDVTYGTSGLIVAGGEGVVRHVDWNSSWRYWQIVVEMSARYTSVSGEVRATREKLFSFPPESLTIHPEERTQ